MPPKKKQKTGASSSAPVRNEELETPNLPSAEPETQEHDKEGDAVNADSEIDDVPDHEYVRVFRPMFDCRLAVGTEELGEEDEENEGEKEDEYEHENQVYAAKIYKKANIHHCAEKKMLQPARNFPGWKWLVKFDAGLKKKTDEGRVSMWAALSSMVLWLTEGPGTDYIMNDDGERTEEISALTGTALLSGLASIEEAGELKADSKFLDLGIVITSFLFWAKDHERYGIEDESVAWRAPAVAYFDRSGFGFDKGISGTEDLLKKFRGNRRYSTSGKIGGTKHDITKMSRTERAGYAFDKKDPLRDVSAKDLREGLIEIG
ncbi:hypothetical protein PMIN01_07753 [Paraphaeosphaeria minitans]|uniref:Uncharacterized protein n=1 Tax=Paraphaeosphaeria minitans TaxID=565426 RepID=A0A9P6GH11_9PLEO|nr:hypothetical protein PMIN01_07753 [Paraphaeosphaeria minitans]